MQAPTLEVITDTARLREFQEEWFVFAHEDDFATPFQSPEWLITWWGHFGSGELRVMVFRDHGRLVAVMPMFLHQWCGRCQLTLIGSGITDYLDPVFAPGYAAPITGCIAQQLEKWPDWELCKWQDLSRDTPLGSLGTAEADMPCSEIPMERSFDGFRESLPADLKRNLRRDKAKAERVAPLVFEVADEPDQSLVSTLIKLHRERWQSAGQDGMIEANGAEPFLRKVVPVLARRGAIRLFVIRFDSRVVAAILAICDRTTIFGYLSAFDPQYEQFSFGREVLAQALRYAHDNGYRTWNFLRGEEPYKFLWGAQTREKRRVIIER